MTDGNAPVARGYPGNVDVADLVAKLDVQFNIYLESRYGLGKAEFLEEIWENKALILAALRHLAAATNAPQVTAHAQAAPDATRMRRAILGYLDVHDACGGSESVSAERFADARHALREAVAEVPEAAQGSPGCGVWRPIETVLARSNDEPMLLYFPPTVAGSYKQSTQPAMYRTGHPDDFPFRKPSHYMLVGSPSSEAK